MCHESSYGQEVVSSGCENGEKVENMKKKNPREKYSELPVHNWSLVLELNVVLLWVAISYP